MMEKLMTVSWKKSGKIFYYCNELCILQESLKKAFKKLTNQKNDVDSLLEMEQQKHTRREQELREQLEQAYSELQAGSGDVPPVSTDNTEMHKTHTLQLDSLIAKLAQVQSELER